MKKNVIVFSAIAIAVLGTGYVFLQRQGSKVSTQTSEQSQTETNQIAPASDPTSQIEEKTNSVIVYTDSGFSPMNSTAKKGDTIVFKNQSTSSMWVASAMHPTHTEYPTTGGCIGSTFDACAGILPEKEWSFTFDIVGTWKYHNHLNPAHYGSITIQ